MPPPPPPSCCLPPPPRVLIAGYSTGTSVRGKESGSGRRGGEMGNRLRIHKASGSRLPGSRAPSPSASAPAPGQRRGQATGRKMVIWRLPKPEHLPPRLPHLGHPAPKSTPNAVRPRVGLPRPQRGDMTCPAGQVPKQQGPMWVLARLPPSASLFQENLRRRPTQPLLRRRCQFLSGRTGHAVVRPPTSVW